MKTFTYEKSQSLFKRAAKIIPCGIYGHYSPAPLVPPTYYPFYTSQAKGCRFRDVDGNEFIDYMCAYGPMILGYNHEKVEAAAAEQLAKGDLTTGTPPVMVELAEYMVDLITGVDWVFFAKNGADVTSFAVMAARDATGRKKIVMMKGGYHGTAPWMQAPGHHGLIEEDYNNIIRIRWNHVEDFERVINENPGRIAGFIASPYHHPVFADNELPADGYWEKIGSLCKKEGIVLIIDDIRCGFRLDMRGSCECFGIKPDLTCFAKAMGNGYPVSVLAGTEALKGIAARIFYTGTTWFQAVPMAAALAALKELQRIDAPGIMSAQGTKLLDGIAERAGHFGFDLKISGHPTMPYLRIADDESLMLHQEWCAECTRRGAYFTPHHNWFISTAHGDDDIQQTLDVVEDAFKAVKEKRTR
jgi:glutamate-1-semialdehyde 2,1-aminomutase